MNQLLETVVDTGPRSFVVLGMAATALILGVVACVLGHRRRNWTGPPRRLAVAAGSSALLASGFVFAATQAWRSVITQQFLSSTRPAKGYVDSHMVNLAIRVQFAGLVFIGALILLALTVVVLAPIRGHRSLAMSRLRAVAMLLPAWPAAGGVLLYGLRMSQGFMAVAATDPSMKTVELLRSIDGAYPIIESARVGLLVLVALGAIATVVLSRRGARRPVSSVRLAAGVLVFLVGLLAFVSTRGHAADRRPLPILQGATDDTYASKVPGLSPCSPPEPAPVLEIANDLVKFDGIRVDPTEFQDRFETDRNNHAFLHDGRPMPYLIVIADRAAPTDRAIPYLQKLREDTTILLASANAYPFVSKTFGTIARYEFCGRTFRLVYRETATPLSRYRTWSDVAAAINGDSAMLETAPW